MSLETSSSAAPTSSERVTALDDPQLRPFVALFYTAWADGELDWSERRALLRRVADKPWLRPAARLVIEDWLRRPPTQTELHQLRELVGRIAHTLRPESRRTLAAMAKGLIDVSTAEGLDHGEIDALFGDFAYASVPLADTAPPAEEPVPDWAAELGRVLDGDDHAVRAKVRALLSNPEWRAYGLDKGEYRRKVLGWIRELAAAGLGSAAYPGIVGKETDLRAFMVIFEMLGLGDLSLLVKFGVQFGLFGGSLFFLGTERHHALLPKVASAEVLGCFAMSEVGHGSNVAGLETVARYEHPSREIVIETPGESARKDWVGSAAEDAHYATVFADLEVDGQRHGVHAVLVRIRDDDGKLLPGVRAGDVGHKAGLNGVDNGRLWFESVRVPVDNLLDRFASIDAEGHYQSAIDSQGRRFFTMLGTLVGGRLGVGSSAVSAAKGALTIAVRYALARRQFGEPEREMLLLDYPSHQRRLLPQLASTVVLHFAFDMLRDRYVATLAATDADTRELEAQVAALKVKGSRHGFDTAQACREACGGQGYVSVNRIADIRADVDVFTTFEGDNVVLSQLVAKSLLAEYKGQFEGRSWIGALGIVGQRAVERALEKNPIAARRVDQEHLRDSEFVLGALRARESRLVETLAGRIQRRLKEGKPVGEALVEVQGHVLAAADAHGDRIVFEWFVAKTAEVGGAPGEVLRRLGALHGLSVLERHMAWYLEQGWFEPSKARALRKQVDVLCGEVRADARGVVEAFGIPDACLAAPIAFFDPAHPRLE